MPRNVHSSTLLSYENKNFKQLLLLLYLYTCIYTIISKKELGTYERFFFGGFV